MYFDADTASEHLFLPPFPAVALARALARILSLTLVPARAQLPIGLLLVALWESLSGNGPLEDTWRRIRDGWRVALRGLTSFSTARFSPGSRIPVTGPVRKAKRKRQSRTRHILIEWQHPCARIIATKNTARG